ncbi:MAG: glycosyltransferase [Pseudomonadota bacterium]
MKALVIGPIVADYDIGYNDSVARALNGHGFETRKVEFYVTTPPGLANRILIDAAMLVGHRRHYDAYVADFNRRVLDQYKAFRPDLVFVIRGSKLSAETLDAMGSARKVIWFHDSARRSDISPEQLRLYDRVYVFEAGDIPWLREQLGIESSFLPMGFDPDVYRPMPEVEKDIDVFFVGKYYPERRETLERLARDFADRKLRFYGRYVRYREPKTWGQHLRYKLSGQGGVFINRSLNPGEINRMYARAKICLNMHHAQSSHGCNPRVYEIMGAGAFQLVDDLPYLRDTLGDVLDRYADYGQLRDAIAHFLFDDAARERATDTSRRAALTDHSFARRLGVVLADLDMPRDPGAQGTQP